MVLNIDNFYDFRHDIRSIASLEDYKPGLLAIGYKNGNIGMFDFEECKELEVWEEAHLSEIRSMVVMNKYQRNVFLTSCDSELKFWDLTNGKCLNKVKEMSFVSCLTYMGSLIATQFITGHSMMIKLW
eukprot:CAMPEP_0170522762 /NCGR_PEP_ID=MMETSP0209-20121228/8191_1 /TAXON_ID=665100 ORGANISM="Litonotus pictus, Strain P1" /NCGR_SAMPLE_ID=MMETSP0209 /ASSEMBLY_ACC=CAM_ASM_000301 /LENGTH=127 /DNA_ID=CAMNT_0010810447 /DNA_START=126 /DNA_END=506 /DNA_ORIENTATION=+